jgi:hypothetical protein
LLDIYSLKVMAEFLAWLNDLHQLGFALFSQLALCPYNKIIITRTLRNEQLTGHDKAKLFHHQTRVHSRLLMDNDHPWQARCVLASEVHHQLQ